MIRLDYNSSDSDIVSTVKTFGSSQPEGTFNLTAISTDYYACERHTWLCPGGLADPTSTFNRCGRLRNSKIPFRSVTSIQRNYLDCIELSGGLEGPIQLIRALKRRLSTAPSTTELSSSVCDGRSANVRS